MKKLLILSTGAVSLVAGGLMLAPSLVQAQGNNGSGNGAGNGYQYQQSLITKAKALGLTENQLRTQLQSKTLLQIAKDKGLTQNQFQNKMEQAAEARWKERGLTQAQIDSRKAVMEQRQANCDGTGSNGNMNQHRGNR